MSLRPFLAAGALALVAASATCAGPYPLESGLGKVVGAGGGGGPDASIPPKVDGGIDAGPSAWRVAVQEVVAARGSMHNARFGAALHGLGVSGVIAGTSIDGGTTVTWMAEPTSGYFETWEFSVGRPELIRAINADGWHCGAGTAQEVSGGISGTAMVGRGSTGYRLLPDPVSSSCRDMNSTRVTVGDWKGHGFLRWPDGGVISFEFFPWPDGGGRTGFINTEARAINERNEVVGALQYGEPFGRGNPAALYWSPEAGPILLDNDVRYAVTRDINNHGHIVGAGIDHNSLRAAMLWLDPRDAGIHLPLPTGLVMGEALSINDDGVIVGVGLDENFESHGVLWWNGKPYLADDLVAGQVEGTVYALSHVNNKGRVAGTITELVTTADGGQSYRPHGPIVIDLLEYPR